MKLFSKNLTLPLLSLCLLLGCVPVAEHNQTKVMKASEVKITAGQPTQTEAPAEKPEAGSASPAEAKSK